jgi:hypothetical protein
VHSVNLYGASFKIAQRRARRRTTDLTLRSPSRGRICRSATARRTTTRGAGANPTVAVAARTRPKRVVSKLGADGKGPIRTITGDSITSSKGTVWLTEERCDGTLTRVLKGTVSVLNRHTRRTVTVRTGRSYLAKRP